MRHEKDSEAHRVSRPPPYTPFLAIWTFCVGDRRPRLNGLIESLFLSLDLPWLSRTPTEGPSSARQPRMYAYLRSIDHTQHRDLKCDYFVG